MENPVLLPLQKNDTNIESIQIMRGIAAILVVLLHISIKGEQYGNNALHGFTIGGAGVDLFFIISGYIMCVSTINRDLNFSQFMLHRIRRIIPLYWLSTTIGLIIFLVKPEIVNTSGGETGIWASYTLIPTGQRYLNSNGWTLSFEFLFYILFGMLIHKGTYRAMQLSSVVLLAMVGVVLLFSGNSDIFGFTTSNLYLEFIYGMGCFYLFNKKIIKPNTTLGMCLCSLGVLLLAAEAIGKVPNQEDGRGWLWGIPMLMVFTGFLCLEGFIKGSASRLKKLLLQAGNSSYSLYLFHPFSLSATALSLKWLHLTSNPYLFALILFVVTAISGYIIYVYIERPLVTVSKKFLAKKS
ncbi:MULTISPECIES: acyltransferase family protein [Niastella]|uniref:Acyltransferase n=1 Tax=Niastella soli TaxID=2821487 RepID=A0ABS3YPT1_9BACT|nr:acyltransferase [Niastella soli]MBO9199907.1 acyltransferase [Niastella soli]